MYRYLALILVFILLWAVPVAAADSKAEKETKISRVELFVEKITIRVNHTRMLTASVYPISAPDDTIYWESANPEIAIVDEDGVVTAISPGETTVTATSVNGKTSSCKVSVPSAVVRSLRQDVENADLPLATYKSGEQLMAPALKLDTENALKALPRGGAATLTYRDKTGVSSAALRAAAYTAAYEGGSVQVRFQSYDEAGALLAQLTLDPAQVGDGDYSVKPGVRVDAAGTEAVSGQVAPLIRGNYTVVRLEQPGNYGLPVNIAVKANLAGLDPGSLRLYHWDGSALTELGDANPWVDGSGYLHFTTTKGGAVIVCNASIA